MNLALGIWLVVVSDVAFPSLNPYAGPPNHPTIQPPAVQSGLPMNGLPSMRPRAGADPSRRRQPLQSGRRWDVPLDTRAPESFIPLPPTDAGAAVERFPWGPPTAMGDSTATMPGSAYGGMGTFGLAPYSRPRSSRPSYRGEAPSRQRTSNGLSQAMQRAAVHAPIGPVGKPFDGYRPDPALSPYMELFRRDTSTVSDNYNSLVKPRLQQRQTNRSVGKGIRGLQNSSRRQGSAIRQFGRQTMQGNAVPEYFRNYGGYHPGLGR